MKRTQLYLDDQLWKALRIRARNEKTTVSELVRRALREHYLIDRERRAKAMSDVVGIWADRDIDSTEYVRELRNDNRLERLYKD